MGDGVGWHWKGEPGEAEMVAEVADLGRRATYQDVIDAHPRWIAQIMDGRLYLQRRPWAAHGLAMSALLTLLGSRYMAGQENPAEPWLILPRPEVHFREPPDKDVLVPDFVGWRQETAPSIQVDYFTQVPDWICEVLLPFTREVDLTIKWDIYAREGLRYLWLLDPDAQALEAFELRQGRWTRLGRVVKDGMVALPPFTSQPFSLGSLWR